MMVCQHPSLLACQRNMQQRRGRCNLATIFGVWQVPAATQRRDLLDGVPVALLRPVRPTFVATGRRAGWATELQRHLGSGPHPGADDTLALEASASLHSTTGACPRCVPRHEAEGPGPCRHPVVSATLVKAGSHRGLPLDVAEVRNAEGQAKQDGALQAAKRLLARVRQAHPRLPLVVWGEDLDGPEPVVCPWRAARLHPVVVWKPPAHPERDKWVEEIEALRGCA
jgi:hypothetical protein